MFMTFYNMDEAYPVLYQHVQNNGFWCEPRGKVCKEVRPASFRLERPDMALYTGSDRKLNYRFFALEAATYISGRGDSIAAKVLTNCNNNMKQFINEKTKEFDGAYGPRLADGLKKAYDILKKDPWSRQAVASIWNNEEERITFDLPCTLSLQFYCIPDGDEFEGPPKLCMMTTMRSNDLNWGTPYDVAAFCEIQCCMARCLGMGLGHYTHSVGSLHYYRETPPMLSCKKELNSPLLPFMSVVQSDGLDEKKTWEEVALDASNLIEESYSFYLNMGYAPWTLETKKNDSYWIARLKELMRFTWKSR